MEKMIFIPNRLTLFHKIRSSIGMPALVSEDERPFIPLTYVLRGRAGRVFVFGQRLSQIDA
jgi:hypothetical protein